LLLTLTSWSTSSEGNLCATAQLLYAEQNGDGKIDVVDVITLIEEEE